MPSIKYKNSDDKTVNGFGDEWEKFNQLNLNDEEKERIFNEYFSIFPWAEIDSCAVGADIGCGSGRWATIVAPKVGKLILIDASEKALDVAKENLSQSKNVDFFLASVGEIPLANHSLDFAYSLGVLHHVPDTNQAINEVARVLKKGGFFLMYLYYAFDNRGAAFKISWKISDYLRKSISRLPFPYKYGICQIIAVLVYWPFSRLSRVAEYIGINTQSWPLSYYQNKSFYVMRNDSLDRFGTRLEQRFTKVEIYNMLRGAGFDQIVFSASRPYWCVVAKKL